MIKMAERKAPSLWLGQYVRSLFWSSKGQTTLGRPRRWWSGETHCQPTILRNSMFGKWRLIQKGLIFPIGDLFCKPFAFSSFPMVSICNREHSIWVSEDFPIFIIRCEHGDTTEPIGDEPKEATWLRRKKNLLEYFGMWLYSSIVRLFYFFFDINV